MNRFLGSLLAVILVFIGGCATINIKTKEVDVSTGVFGGNIAKMRESIKYLQTQKGKMTKEEVREAGWDCYRKNVQRFSGPSAMPLVVGDVKNTADLSSEEKIEASANAANAFEACKFPELKVKSKKDRWFLSKNKGETRGSEMAFVIIFKNGALFNAREDTARLRDEPEVEKSFGGNVLETLFGIGISAGKKF